MRIKLELEMLVSEERGKLEYPEENALEQGREPTTNSNHTWRRVQESDPGNIGGSEISHHYARPYSPLGGDVKPMSHEINKRLLIM